MEKTVTYSKDGKEAKMTLIDSAAAVIEYKRVFGTSFFEDMREDYSTALLQISYLMQKPKISDRISAEDYLNSLPLSAVPKIAEAVGEMMNGESPEGDSDKGKN